MPVLAGPGSAWCEDQSPLSAGMAMRPHQRGAAVQACALLRMALDGGLLAVTPGRRLDRAGHHRTACDVAQSRADAPEFIRHGRAYTERRARLVSLAT